MRIILPLLVVGISEVIFINLVKIITEKQWAFKNEKNNKKEGNVEVPSYCEFVNKKEKYTDHVTLGVGYGVSFGLLIGTILSTDFGVMCLVYGQLAGMMVGMAVGYYMKNSR